LSPARCATRGSARITARSFTGGAKPSTAIPEPHEGTTVRAAMQNLQGDGYLVSYVWAYDVRTVAEWILAKSPIVLGTDWLDSMFYTHDYKGSTFIKFDPASPIVGGHAYLAFAVDLNKKCPDGTVGALEIQN
jgi:hypothetical protein